MMHHTRTGMCRVVSMVPAGWRGLFIARGRYAMRLCVIFGLVLATTACNRADSSLVGRDESQPVSGDALAMGDAANGEVVFNRGCNNCHAVTTEARIGPGLAGVFEPDGPDLPNGVDYDGNLPNGEPITVDTVKTWIRSGGAGEIGAMPANGAIADLSDDDLDDVIAYLTTLTK